MQEIEIKFLDINPQDIEEKLLALGAKKIFDEILEEWIFQRPEWLPYHGRARIRKQGIKVLVAYKETRQETGKGNLEIEFEVSNAQKAKEFIEYLGIPLLRHQQKRRIHFILNSVFIDIDFWPQIPPFIEIEGKSLKKIEDIARKLGLQIKDACQFDARRVIKEIYKVDIDAIREYVFTK